MRTFLTHNPEDLQAYYGRALPELRAIADVVFNPLDRDLTTPELVAAAKDCDVIIAHRSTPGDAALFAALPGLLAFLRCAVDISTSTFPLPAQPVCWSAKPTRASFRQPQNWPWR